MVDIIDMTFKVLHIGNKHHQQPVITVGVAVKCDDTAEQQPF
jgi:hypothetical protein